MKLLVVATLCLVACDSSEKVEEKPGPAKENATKSVSTPAPPPPTTTPPPTVATKSETAEVPADLEQLAEMPPLTAEATPQEIERRLTKSLDALTEFLELIAEIDDCTKMGIALTKFAKVNKRLLVSLEQYDKDPEIERRVTKLMSKQGGKWVQKLADNLSKCATNPIVIGALMQLSKDQ